MTPTQAPTAFLTLEPTVQPTPPTPTPMPSAFVTTHPTMTPTQAPCADGTPVYNSCSEYASIKTCSGRNCCDHGKEGSVRRRNWAGDAKENCPLSCGYCSVPTLSPTAHPTLAPTFLPTPAPPTPLPTPQPTECVDGTPNYNSCSDYASVKTCSGRNCCDHGKEGSVRRRNWAGDAKENCPVSCGYCSLPSF